MPKPGAPISHDAIKRSLKSKFKLIVSENRILVETINGYVKKAEKVYKDMEASDDVSPKQFAKAMEKLERAYSACVRLIMVASDLFEKGDSEGLKNRDLVASSCESDTTVFSSESSATIKVANPAAARRSTEHARLMDTDTSIRNESLGAGSETIEHADTNRTRKTPNEKGLQRRSKSSEVRLQDGTRMRVKPQPASRKLRVADAAETSGMEVSNTESERLFVHPGGNPDFDHLIELQRFLHGLENEKQQTDHPNPCVAKEKELPSYKIHREKITIVSKENGDGKEPAEEPVPHSLPHRLKVLRAAIENFRDRSSGDERIAQALNDIRELVLKNKESKDSLGGKDYQPECETKDGYNAQMSPISDSVSTENHLRIGQLCNSLAEDQDVKEVDGHALQQDSADVQQGSKQRDGSGGQVTAPQVTAGDGNNQTSKHTQSVEKGQQVHVHQLQQAYPDQMRAKERGQSPQQRPASQHPTQASPAQSPRASSDDKEDINQIIVNRIVDMVSAKLVPRLQKSGAEDGAVSTQHGSGRTAESTGRDELNRTADGVHSPTQLACNCFPHALQQGNYCGNCGHIPKFRLYYPPGQNQHELEKLQRRSHRPKMVSFVEDCDSGAQCNAWDPRYAFDSRQVSHDTSPTRVTRPFVFKEDETVQQQNYRSQSNSRYTSPHKKTMYSVQQPLPPQRCTSLQQQQQQQHPPVRRILHSEDLFVAEHEVNVDKDEESERVDESDQEVMSERLPHPSQQQDTLSKRVPGHESFAWGKRPAPKSPSPIETSEYRAIHPAQRCSTPQHQSAAHRNDSFGRNFNPDTQKAPQAIPQERQWFSSPQQPSESGSVEENKVCPTEANAHTRFPYRHSESAQLEQTPGDYSDWQTVSASEHFSPNSEWVQNQISQTSVVPHSQQAGEAPRPCPTRLPRSATPQAQTHHPVGGYPSSMSNKGTYGNLKSYEPVHQTSGSSCEGSPAFSGDEKVHGDNTTSSHDESDGKESKPPRPEVVCIDAMQLHADASRTITLSNLPLDLNEKELLSIFKKYGHVTKIYYIKDRNTGLFQGRAYGKFSKASEAFQAAQDLQKLSIDGQEVCVQLYVNTP